MRSKFYFIKHVLSISLAMRPRILVCGLERAGYRIFNLLQQQGATVVGINETPVPNEKDIVVGDLQAASTLVAAGIQEAQTIIIAVNDDTVNLAILMQARLLNPRIRVINRLFNTSLGDRLDQTLSDHVAMSVSALAAPIFAFAALGSRAIGHLQLFNQTWPIYEEYIHPDHPWKDCQLSDLWDDRTRMLIYYLPCSGDITQDLVTGVLSEKCLQEGDRLIIGTQPSIRLSQHSWLRKVGRLPGSLRRFQRYTHSTMVALLILLVTILATTIIYVSFSLDKPSLIDALYFSVGLITGAGGNEKVAERAPETIKLFTIMVMLAGAGVVGICYALLNDFVLGTRLTEFWNVARVPQRDHFVVCGLGGVGVKVVQQLRSHGYDVVVIERDPNNRFLNTVRLMQVPVIQGEANQAIVLQTANIDKATALLTVTSNDTVNLEVALTAKGLAPRLPTVVRIQDPQYAKMVQHVFEFEAVLSPIEVAAPAFAAAALGGQILGNGMTANNLWIALAVLITPAHPFCGQSTKDIASAVDLVPLYLETQHQTVHGWNLLNAYLQAGDVLYLTIPAVRLEHLWSTTAVSVTMQYE
jgi:Trk K+ transport system NAD-binding subunit